MDEKRFQELMAHLKSQGFTPDENEVRSIVQKEMGGSPLSHAEPAREKTALLGRGALRTAGQGVSLGWSDEAVGAIRGALSPNLTVSQGIESEREGLRRYREDHPIAAPVIEIGSGIASGAAASLATGGAALPTLARAVKVGAGLGFVGGSGMSEGGLVDRAVGGAVGAGIGAATAGGLGKLGIGVQKATPVPQRKALNQLARRAGSDETSLNAIADEAMPGPNTLGKVSSDKPLIMADYGGENLRGATRAARTQPGIGKNQIPEMLAERSAGAEERVLDDLLQTTGLRDRTNTFQKAEDIIKERAETSRPLYDAAYYSTTTPERVTESAIRVNGRLFAGRNHFEAYEKAQQAFPEFGDGLADWTGFVTSEGREVTRDEAADIARRAAQLKPGREGMPKISSESIAAGTRESAAPPTRVDRAIKDDRLRKFFKIPQFQKAYERAERIAALEGDKLPALEKLIADGGSVPVKAVDYMKRGLDDLIESGSRGENGLGKAEAGALRKLKNEMLDVTDELVPEFMEARGYYRGESELLEALESGRGLFKMHPDQAAQILKNPKLSQGERELMKRGMFEALADRIENIPTGNDIARRVGDKTMDQKRLRLLFDDDASFERFKELLGQEARMHQTKNYVTGGSQTADKLAELADLAGVGGFERLADVVGANPMGMLRSGLRALGRKVDETTGEATAEHMTPLLTAQGKDIRFGLEKLKGSAKVAEEERRRKLLRALPPVGGLSGAYGGRKERRQ